MKLILPFPPSINVLYGHTKFGQKGKKRFLSPAGRLFCAKVYECIAEKRSLKNKPFPFEFGGKFRVVLDLFPPDRRKRDIDNYTKVVFDAITKAGGVWADDALVKLKLIRMHDKDADNPRCEIKIQEFSKFFGIVI